MIGEKRYYVYILASGKHRTLYIGVTNDLLKRAFEHKEKLVEGFTKKHYVHKLVWFEVHQEIEAAIIREKRLKNWNRQWKVNLIEEHNPEWIDLYIDMNK